MSALKPKDIRLIMEILELPLTVAADEIDCHKGDLSAAINRRRPKREIIKKFAPYLGRKVSEAVLDGAAADAAG